jgi:hypothetical protein
MDGTSGGDYFLMTQETALPVDSSKSKRTTIKAGSENILRWLAMISAGVTKSTQYFLRSRKTEAGVAPAKSDGDHASIVADACEKATATSPTTQESVTTPVTADARPDPIAPIALDQDEIERRRNLVRKLFNDFWNGAHEKPVGFKDRLDQAEDYLNERLAANGEIWQLDATTRTLLGLPARLNSRDNVKNPAARR